MNITHAYIFSHCDNSANPEESVMMLHSKTFDQSCSRPQRPKQLVRQMATTTENSSAENTTFIEEKRLRVSGGRMPSRQWTTDASFSGLLTSKSFRVSSALKCSLCRWRCMQ